MNKTLKKVFSLAAAGAITFSLAATTAISTVYADTSVTIQDSNTGGKTNTSDGQTYSGYKLFDVTVSKDANDKKHYTYTVDSDYKTILTDSTVLTALGLTDSNKTYTVDNVLTKLEEYSGQNDAEPVQKFAKAVYKLIQSGNKTADVTFTEDTPLDVADGYYLIAENTTSDTNDDTKTNPDTASCLILNTADSVDGAMTITTKEEAPTVTKKVEETDDSANKTAGWQDAADYDVNDTIKYRLAGTLSSKYDQYDVYHYEFTDTLSKGLSLDLDLNDDETYDNVKVYAFNGTPSSTVESDTTLNGYTDITDWFTINTADYSGSNTEYSGGTVLTISCDNLKAKDTGDNRIALTSDYSIIVRYTATLDSDAVMTSAGNPNEVTLTYTDNPNTSDTGKTNTTPEDKVTVYTYKIQPTKYADTTSTTLSGAKFKLYKVGAPKSTTEDPYTYTSGTTTTTYNYVGTATSGDDGTFSFERIDAGQYALVETSAPAGYKAVDPIRFTVTATYDTNLDDTTSVAYNLTVTDDSDGTMTTATDNNNTTDVTTDDVTYITDSIIDSSSSKLPTTGGIGTTIFYLCGGALVAFAVVMLISKKRNSAE